MFKVSEQDLVFTWNLSVNVEIQIQDLTLYPLTVHPKCVCMNMCACVCKHIIELFGYCKGGTS